MAENLAARCLLDDTAACTDKEKGYIDKMKAKGGKTEAAAELARLEGMNSLAMAGELKKWLKQRVAILKQLAA